jgi:proteasome lid subunit RPN8/RPN11
MTPRKFKVLAQEGDAYSLDVHRRNPLPLAPARGHLIIPESVRAITETSLRGFYGPDGRHEGVVFWVGRETGADQLVAMAIIPRAVHGPAFFRISASEVGKVAHQARTRRLVVLAQVHSHPGTDTRHSDADDTLVLMAREGMFSIVVGNYGDDGITVEEGAGIHQFQDGRWVQIEDSNTAVIVVPAGMNS